MHNGHKLFTEGVQLVHNHDGKVCIVRKKMQNSTVRIYFQLKNRVVQTPLLAIHKILIT